VSSPITLRIFGSPPKEEVLKQMREAFLKQAGIVITRLDDQRDSVTYNDALPVTIDFDRVPVTALIDKYQQLTGLELVCDPNARVTHSAITLHSTTPLTRDQAIKMLEETLLTQAGVKITRLDDKHASVTREDALQTTR
jgi:type II secretory pathway component GspD/PulD (secretin)